MKAIFGLLLAGALSGALSAEEGVLEHAAKNTVIHGYISTDYQGGVLVNDRTETNKITPNFEQLRFIFGFQSELAEKIVFNSEVEFEHATRAGVKTGSVAVASPGSGSCSTCTTQVLNSASAGLEVEIEQGWVEFRHLSWLRPRVGVVLVPVGRLNLHHDSDLVDTVDRPLTDQQVIGTTWFEPGAGFTGGVELGEGLKLDWQAFVINGLRGTAKNAGDEAKLRDLRMHKDAANDNNTDKAVAGRLTVSPWQGFEVAASGYRGAYDPAGALFINYVALDGLYQWAGLELQGEWVEMHTDLPDQARAQNGQLPKTDPGYFLKSDPVSTPFAGLRGGWWAQLLYQLPLGAWGRLEPFVNVCQLDPNKEVVTSADQTRTTYGLNYRPIDSVVFKLNYADTQYVKGYANNGGGISAVVDQRLQASLAAAY